MANGFLNIPSLTSEVSRENPYLNSEFGVDWSSMGLNNLNTVYDNNNGGGFNNFMGSTVGNNYSGALGSIIGTGLTLWGGYKSYKTYKNLKYDDYKNELAFTQIDIDRENTMQSLYRNNAQIRTFLPQTQVEISCRRSNVNAVSPIKNTLSLFLTTLWKLAFTRRK